MLIATAINILDVELNISTSYTGYIPEICFGLYIESWPNKLYVIKPVGYVFKEMITKEIETAQTDRQDKNISCGGQVESLDSSALGAPLSRQGKGVNSLQNICNYLPGGRYRILHICAKIVEVGNGGSFGRPSDAEERRKHIKVDNATLHKSKEAGCQDLLQ